ncbi:MAG: cyclic nucleotide-binding domain-containing protein [Acidobacteriaceae bacterium]|nr:cyclic nucleotide-binding domain-containing protein [Acidobacteriaceae bacterium]
MSTIRDRAITAPHPGLDELRSVTIFSDLEDSDLNWLVEHMAAFDVQAGELIIRRGEPAEHLVVILDGELRAEREDGRVFIAPKGHVSGLLPFSRLTQYPANARSNLPMRVAVLAKEHFPEMSRRMPILQERLVNVMADRIRETTKEEQQNEKLAALGRLSAGLAHELNNPASAARRAADELRKALAEVRAAVVRLDRRGLPNDSRLFLAELELNWAAKEGPQTALDTLERSEREEELADWMVARHIKQPWDLAAALVDLGCRKQTLDEVEKHVPAEFLDDVFLRMSAAFTISRLAEQIESSTTRISEMVRAIKEYSYMDQAPQQEIDIHQGIENTLIMLHYRLKNGVEVVREYDRALPNVCAHGSELNQIWTNLITNAVDAMQGNGKLTIRTMRDGRCVRVEIIDNGPGIADGIKSRIFEPFFTTKPVGQGTGLGLETVQRIVRKHGGDVRFTSRQGETNFIVRIPFSGSGP